MAENNSIQKDPHDQRIKYTNEDAKIFADNSCYNLLEIFFGDGRNMIAFANDGFNVEGIDDGVQQHNDYVNLAQDKLSKIKLKAIIAPIFNAVLPYKDNSYQGIYAWHYINHNYKKNIVILFKEIHRILAKDGVFSMRFTSMEEFKYKHIDGDIIEDIISKEEANYGHKPQRLRLLAPQTFCKLTGKEANIPHYAYYEEELKKDLENLGFEIIKFDTVLWNHHVWCKKK